MDDQPVSRPPRATPDVLRNRVKLRLLIAGVDAATVEDFDQQSAIDLLRSQVLWGGEERITIRELAIRSGLDVELCRRARMFMGLPDPGDEALCRVEEIETFKGFAAGIELYGADPILHFTRVLGSALATVAEASLSVFARTLTHGALADLAPSGPPIPPDSEHPGPDDAGSNDTAPNDTAPHDTRGGLTATGPLAPDVVGSSDPAELSEQELIDAYAYTLAAFDALESFQIVPTVLQTVAKLQFDLATERLTADPGQPRTMAVGFVDLTNSTKASEQLGLDAMAQALTDFEEWAVELVVGAGGRVVKYIGDEVMFIAPDLPAAAGAAKELLERVEAHPVLRSARGGLASGEMLSRDGDWYGPTVNLAARLVDKARPGTILLSGSDAEEVDGATQRGRRRLRDISERVDVWRMG